MKKNYYDALGLSKDCKEKEILQAFIKKMKENPSPIVIEAYEVLIQPHLRKQYDTTFQETYEVSQTIIERELPIPLRKFIHEYRNIIYDLNNICEFDISNLFLFVNILEFTLEGLEENKTHKNPQLLLK